MIQLTKTMALAAAVIAAALLLFTSIAFGQSANLPDVEGYAYVRDVDTIVVADVPIRLDGIDGPEMDTAVGRDARWWMTSLLAGRTVSCYLTGAKTYDRFVGTCYIHNYGEAPKDIGAMAIAAGMALDCRRYSGGKYAQYETEAGKSRIRRSSYCN